MSQVITSTDLNDYMNKTLVDSVASVVVDAVNTWLDTYTKRCFGQSKTVTERYDWKRVLYLRHMDVTAIASIKAGFPGQVQATLPTTSYWFNVFGRVTMFAQMARPGATSSGSIYYHDYLEVTYSYGLTDIPDDLRLAVLGIAAGFYNWAVNGQKDVVASSVGSYRLEYAGKVRPVAGTKDPAMNTADANFAIVDSYRMRSQ